MKELFQPGEWHIKIIWFIGVLAISFVATFYYRKLAASRNIIAKINFRTLHTKVVPRGGGIAFALVFSLFIFCMWITDSTPTWEMLSFCAGGLAASLLGFIDDIYEISAVKKLLAQSILSVYFFLVFFSHHPFPPDQDAALFLSVLLTGVWLFVPVWFINLFNFIDGIDGMAVSASVFTCFAMILLLLLKKGDPGLIVIFSVLAAACIGFAFFNLPPASLFMGDAGSIFLGYSMGMLILITVYSGEISVWNWLIVLSYFLADTTSTTVTRMFLVKKWYGVHRSHAYQNLARIRQSHAKITYGVLLYNVLWVAPLLVGSVLRPNLAPVAALMALIPAITWSLRFGPLLSKD